MEDYMQHRLSLMGRDVEDLLLQNNIRARVHNGPSLHGVATFIAKGCGPIATLTWDALEEDLQQTFGAGRVELMLEDGELIIRVELPRADSLLQLLQENAVAVAPVSLLGRDADERPVSLDFGDRNSRHVLFQGSTGAGKTAALRTSAISLAFAARQSQVQMIFVAPLVGREEARGPGLHLLHHLPHALSAVAHDLEDVANVLSFAVEELHHRRRHAVLAPSIVLFIDDLDVLLHEGGAPVREPMRLLLADGAQYGVYLVMSARPECASSRTGIGEILTLKSVARIVGRLDDGCRPAEATDQAHHLRGGGDFLLLSDRSARRFQAAHVDVYEMYWSLEWLQSRRPVPLLAQPYG